jgi:hypothetical protein
MLCPKAAAAYSPGGRLGEEVVSKNCYGPGDDGHAISTSTRGRMD